MSGDNTASKNYYRRLAQEHAELDDPIVKGQMALDRAWEEKLAARARARRTEIPERGDYSPVARLDRELADAQREADLRYARGRYW